jgi:hypothetical protein
MHVFLFVIIQLILYVSLSHKAITLSDAYCIYRELKNISPYVKLSVTISLPSFAYFEKHSE